MNLKKAKMIRKALRIQEVNPREASYNRNLPYVSCWYKVVTNPLTGKGETKRETDIPLLLQKNVGRAIYKRVKKDFRKATQYRVR